MWKNETVAEQDKRSPKERPILLSKDIESKLALLDREVNYLLNKAKFAKPKVKAKAKNSTSSDKSSKANITAEEEVIPPIEESADTKSGGLTSSHGINIVPLWMWKRMIRLEITSYACFPSNAESPEEVQPGEAPPTAESSVHADSDSQSQSTEESATTGRSAIPNDAGEL